MAAAQFGIVDCRGAFKDKGNVVDRIAFFIQLINSEAGLDVFNYLGLILRIDGSAVNYNGNSVAALLFLGDSVGILYSILIILGQHGVDDRPLILAIGILLPLDFTGIFVVDGLTVLLQAQLNVIGTDSLVALTGPELGNLKLNQYELVGDKGAVKIIGVGVLVNSPVAVVVSAIVFDFRFAVYIKLNCVVGVLLAKGSVGGQVFNSFSD